MDNANSREYLEKIKTQVIENLKRTAFAPSVQMTDVPRDPEGMDDEADAILDDMDEDENKDSRYSKRRWDKYVEKDGELSESEDEDEAERNGVRKQAGQPKRRNLMDYHNVNAPTDMDSAAVTPEPTEQQAQAAADDPTAAADATNIPASAEAYAEKEAAVTKSLSASPAPAEATSTTVPPVASPPHPIATDQDGDIEMDTAPAQDTAAAPTDIPTAAAAPTPPTAAESTQVTTPPLSPTTALQGSAYGQAPPTPPSQSALVADPAPTAEQEDENMDDTLDAEDIAQEQEPEQEPAPAKKEEGEEEEGEGENGPVADAVDASVEPKAEPGIEAEGGPSAVPEAKELTP